MLVDESYYLTPDEERETSQIRCKDCACMVPQLLEPREIGCDCEELGHIFPYEVEGCCSFNIPNEETMSHICSKCGIYYPKAQLRNGVCEYCERGLDPLSDPCQDCATRLAGKPCGDCEKPDAVINVNAKGAK